MSDTRNPRYGDGDTHEDIDLETQIAGFGTRCFAAIIDYSILAVPLIAITYLYFQVLGDGASGEAWFSALLFAIHSIVITGYHLFFESSWNGQTPGKKRIGVRVVGANGQSVTTREIIIRNLVRLLDFLPVFYGVGLFVLFASKRTQRLGDMAAQTIVIREQGVESAVHQDLSVDYQHITRIEPLPSYIQVDLLDENDRLEIVRYLHRRTTLQNRQHVVGLLAKRIAARMGVTGAAVDLNSPKQAERFLEQVARAFEIAQQI